MRIRVWSKGRLECGRLRCQAGESGLEPRGNEERRKVLDLGNDVIKRVF